MKELVQLLLPQRFQLESGKKGRRTRRRNKGWIKKGVGGGSEKRKTHPVHCCRTERTAIVISNWTLWLFQDFHSKHWRIGTTNWFKSHHRTISTFIETIKTSIFLFTTPYTKFYERFAWILYEISETSIRILVVSVSTHAALMNWVIIVKHADNGKLIEDNPLRIGWYIYGFLYFPPTDEKCPLDDNSEIEVDTY